jgi:hypothetical protein
MKRAGSKLREIKIVDLRQPIPPAVDGHFPYPLTSVIEEIEIFSLIFRLKRASHFPCPEIAFLTIGFRTASGGCLN